MRSSGNFRFVLLFMVQFGTAHVHAAAGNPLAPVIVLATAVAAGVVTMWLLRRVAPRTRAWITRRRRARMDAGAEQRARALMGELCPHGWRAEITIGGSLGQRGRTGVALEWTEFAGSDGRAAVVRRVSAPSIAEALDAMVADRRTDEALEQIERGAFADGAVWPDP